MNIIVPYDRRVTYRYVTIPKESPVGIIDNSTLEMCFDGRRFQLLETPVNGKPLDALDIDSGEVVTLDFCEFSAGPLSPRAEKSPPSDG